MLQSKKTEKLIQILSIAVPILVALVLGIRNKIDLAHFFYSYDGKMWTEIGSQLKMEYTLMEHFMGYRFGLFNYATKIPGGYADFDYFHISDKITDSK